MNAPVAAMNTGVLTGQSIIHFSMGYESACAVTESGVIGCSGYGIQGELGDGLRTSSVTPVAVESSGVLSGRSILGIDSGDFGVLVWASGGDVYDPYAPADVMQQVGLPASGTCADIVRPDLNWSGVGSGGWSVSWAEWANEGAGGVVCGRTLYYRSGSGRWAIRA